MELGRAIRNYVQESVKRKGIGTAGSPLNRAINELVRHYFATLTKPINYPPPQNLREYIRNAVAENLLSAKAVITSSDYKESVQTDYITVVSIKPPMGYIDGNLHYFSHLKPVKIGETYPYTLHGKTVIVDGAFEGAIGKAMRYNIVDEDSGIIFHPRSGIIQDMTYIEYIDVPLIGSFGEPRTTLGVAGGWKNGNELLNTQYVFPLVDEDNASFLLKTDEGNNSDGEFATSESSYGNLYWTNGIDILSWKGTPTRHFRLPSNINIPGFSSLEAVLYGELSETYEYSAFSTKLYSFGSVLKDSPRYNWPSGGSDRCLILGAMQNNSGVVYIVTQSDRRFAPEGIAGPGFYLMLWKTFSISDEEKIQVDGWEVVREHSYTRNGLPWFGNSSGTEFVCGNGDVLNVAGTLTLKSGSNGTYTTSEDGRDTTVQFEGTNYSEFIDDNLVNSTVAVNFTALSTGFSTASTSQLRSEDVPIVVFEEDIPSDPPRVVGPEDWSGNIEDYYLVGGKLGQGATMVKTPPSGNCGTGTVTITGSCEGKTGTYSETASMTVTLPEGVWCLESDVTYGSLSNIIVVTKITGNTKIVENVSIGCGWMAVWTGTQYNCVYNNTYFGCDSTPSPTGFACSNAYPTPLTDYKARAIELGYATDCQPFYETKLVCTGGEGSVSGDCSTYHAYQGLDTIEIGPYEIPYCGYVMRRQVYTWKCSC